MLKERDWKSTFFIIIIGQAISLVGSGGVQFALIWWLAEQTASPMMMGMAGIAAFIPMTFLSPFAGVAADRYNRKMICIGADMGLGILAAAYAVMLFFVDAPIWSVLVVLFLRGVGGTFHQPSMQAMIPQLVPADYLLKVNGWTQMIVSGSFILGPVVGAILYAAVPMWVILLTDLVGAIFACGTLAMVKIPKLIRSSEGHAGFVAQFKEGVQVYLADRKLLMIVLAEALCMFFYAPLASFYPLMTSDYFSLSAIYGSIVEIGYAAGMMIAALLFSSVLKVKHKVGVAYVGLLGMGVTSALAGMIPPVFTGWILFAIVCSFMGAFGNVHSIPLMTYMQETIPQEKMGRAFSLLGLVGSITMPTGLLISSPIAEKLGVHTWFLISGIGVILIVVTILCISRFIFKKQ